MPKIQLEVIAEPDQGTASVMILTNPNHSSPTPFAVIAGDGNTDYVCGGCKAVLATRAKRGQIKDMVIKCLNCGSFNALRVT